MKSVFPKIIYVLLALLLPGISVSGCGAPAAPPPTLTPAPTAVASPTALPQEVVLTLGAWRISTERINLILNKFHEDNPHITIRLEPVLSGEYDAVLDAQLKTGTAPDMFFVRSFSTSQKLFDQGYLEPLADLPGLSQNFDPPILAPWTTPDGVPYGVPFTASSHGIYYNQDIFKELGLAEPQTWEELLATAQIIKDAGHIPFANASKDSWAVAEIIFMNLAPNFIGGRAGRLEYLSGQRCFNDERVVAAFQAMADLAPYLPDNHELLGYIDSLQLFVQGQAAMWLGGSWDIPYLEENQPDFAWSVFAAPPPAGQPGYVTFHLDVAIGLNAASTHKPEAREFLAWMTTPEFGKLLGNEMPGLFPMHHQAIMLDNPQANTFLALNQGRGTDIRFASEKLGDGSPDGYTLMQDGALAVLRGEQTPQQAADALQSGLAQWFEPAQTCGQ
jgi:raffinose/stachyose/melibiose transport system substrate-binding protein